MVERRRDTGGSDAKEADPPTESCQWRDRNAVLERKPVLVIIDEVRDDTRLLCGHALYELIDMLRVRARALQAAQRAPCTCEAAGSEVVSR